MCADINFALLVIKKSGPASETMTIYCSLPLKNTQNCVYFFLVQVNVTYLMTQRILLYNYLEKFG